MPDPEGQEPTTPTGQEPQAQPSAPTTPVTAQGTPEPGTQPEPQTFDAKYVQQLRAEAASYRTKLKEIEDAQKTEEQKLKDNLTELTPKAQRAERLEAALAAQLEASRKDLPAHIIGLLDKLDTADQLEWIATNREALAQPAVSSGSAMNPARQREQSLEDQVDALLSAESRKFWGF
ncbi:MAG: hypothetical protein M3P51_11325 [Chloroflexota bacterium]|nr:hypothetical protein [Chloroflexota bacterium]